uniref:Uncharacterized protein MANES_02G007900 n=1 Tax=Rhizophora mucronata TaxID=61149 RepID=A0A2P2NHB7_RHIMU
MGCASSKRIQTAVEVYRPPPSSIAVFDINSIQEPWLVVDNISSQEQREKPTSVPPPVLEKFSKFETDAPRSWEEVSKALQEDLLKPTSTSSKPNSLKPPAQDNTAVADILSVKKQDQQNRGSFHTLEELDAKLCPKSQNELRKAGSMRNEFRQTESRVSAESVTGPAGSDIKPVRENIFIVRDRLEREKERKGATVNRWDPLSECPEKVPPGGADSLVIYTTSLRGVRRTHEDCSGVLAVLDGHGVVYDERDVSLHGEFLNELRELLGEGVAVPRIFVKGKYIGGVEELVGLNESGRLGRILSWARVERVVGRKVCEVCGGARFLPCLDCGGSCKILVDGVKERCGKCNENGLVRCAACA